jgi:replicative DNA helicase
MSLKEQEEGTAKTSSSLTFNHISKSVNEALSYVDGRRKGQIKSLATGFEKLDKVLLNGIEWNRIFTIAAMSGSGKSVLCEQLKRNLIQLNPDSNIDILSFEFEMPAREQMLRNISGRTGRSVRNILSCDNAIDDKSFEIISNTAKAFNKYNIWSVETSGSIEQIENTIREFVKYREIHVKKNGLLITIDHVLLTLGKQGEDERKVISQLYRKIVQLKKQFIAAGIPVLFILLSQLNRNIETPERKLNPDLNYPNRTDLFGSSDIFMCSDYVLVIHKPAILNLNSYGPPKPNFPGGLPIYSPKNEDQAMIYFHLLKQRAGEAKILSMLDNFKNSKIDEY